MPKHAPWEAPSDLLEGGISVALDLWCVRIPVVDDLITETGVPSGKIRRGRLFEAAVAQIRSRFVANSCKQLAGTCIRMTGKRASPTERSCCSVCAQWLVAANLGDVVS